MQMDRHPVLGALWSAGKSSCAQTVTGSSPGLRTNVQVMQLVDMTSSNLVFCRFDSYPGHQIIV